MKKLSNNAITVLALLAACPALPATAGSLVLESGPGQINLLELYSSEGCSSCPPAEAWLASLRGSPALWKRFVPLEFHVDYWNRLGWTDKLSKETFTSRQRLYASEMGKWQVYTPELIWNGAEWQSGNGSPAFDSQTTSKPGILRATQTAPGTYSVVFKTGMPLGKLTLYGALLGNGLTSQVTSGENSGRTLNHEFAVLTLVSQPMEKTTGEFSAVVKLKSSLPAANPTSYSVAFWVAETGKQKPLQAVGGNLN